jgi:DNA-binding winged helix-turn-helix (wHTH) protein
MIKRTCHYCGQPLPAHRLNVPMTPVEGRIFDLILRAGEDGILNRDLIDIVWPDDDATKISKTLSVHIAHINEKLAERGYRIAGNSFRRLCKIGKDYGNFLTKKRQQDRTRHPAQAAGRRDRS